MITPFPHIFALLTYLLYSLPNKEKNHQNSCRIDYYRPPHAAKTTPLDGNSEQNAVFELCQRSWGVTSSHVLRVSSLMFNSTFTI